MENLWRASPVALVFHLWPAIFILLGVEILLSGVLSGDRIQYDKATMAVMVLMVLCAMCLAGVDKVMSSNWHLSFERKIFSAACQSVKYSVRVIS